MSTASLELVNGPLASAKAAGLRYVTDEMPGYARKLKGKHFEFYDRDGKKITAESEIARIRALAIPPAYTDVWISPTANGHLQATGRDARGRKQYRYHERWRELRDETKYHKLIDFAKALPRIRERIESDLTLPGLPREKVLATVVELLQTTAIRIGNEEYAQQNQSYGLTTMRNRHAKIHGSTVRFSFTGKSGKRHAIDLRDKRLARVIRQCQDLPGQQLFEYLDDEGTTHAIDSSDVNEYIQEIAGDEFSAKDFRTWLATVTCASLLAHEASTAEGANERKQQVKAVIEAVAKHLGNTPAICRKCYVHPHVIDRYLQEGRLKRPARARALRGLSDDEIFALSLLVKGERNDRIRLKVIGPKTRTIVGERDRRERRAG